MALSKKSIQGLGVLLSTATIAISGFLVVKPSYDQAQSNREEFATIQTETETKNTRLALLEEGVENYDEIQGFVDQFLTYAPAEKDIESASRAISTALVPGTSIVSFTFGTEQAAAAYPIPEASLEGSVPDAPLEATPAEDGEAAGAAAGTVQRMPIQVTVEADSYVTLSNYLDNLAQQDRLITVVSVSSSGAQEGGVSATINGYAFIYAR